LFYSLNTTSNYKSSRSITDSVLNLIMCSME